MTLEVDHDVLSSMARGLGSTAEDLDGACRSIPVSTGTGDAASLLADILFTVSGTSARLVEETGLLGVRVRECEDAYWSIDHEVDQRLREMWSGS